MSRALSSRLGHVVVFLGETLYFHRAPLHPGLYMDTAVKET